MKKKPTIRNTKYTTMGARQAAEKGLNDVLEITPLKPLTSKEYDNQRDANKNDILEKIESAKKYLSIELGAYSISSSAMPEISTSDAKKIKHFKDERYTLLLEDETLNELTKEAIIIYTQMDYLKREFIKSEYKPSYALLCNFMFVFEQFGFWDARKCLDVKAAMGNTRRIIGKEKKDTSNSKTKMIIAKYYRDLLLKYTKELGDNKGKKKAVLGTLNKFKEQIDLKGKRPAKSLDNWMKLL